MLEQERIIEDKAIASRNAVSEYITELTRDLIEHTNETISVSEDVRDLFGLYKRYNEEITNTIDSQFPMLN